MSYSYFQPKNRETSSFNLTASSLRCNWKVFVYKHLPKLLLFKDTLVDSTATTVT